MTARHKDCPHLIEVRRGHAGTRVWEGEPGQSYHEITGQPDGLWRYRGRSPNKLVGVNVTASGWDTEHTPGYRRTEASFDPRVAFAFEGIGDEVIGDFGLVLNGSAGDEIDRADVALGTPEDALVVATSTGHSDCYLIFVDEMMTTGKNVTGTSNHNVRSDITYMLTPGGGQVFSVGSINFAGALSPGTRTTCRGSSRMSRGTFRIEHLANGPAELKAVFAPPACRKQQLVGSSSAKLIQINGANENHTDGNLLPEGRNTDDDKAVAEHGRDEDADHGADDRGHAPEQARSANDDRGDGFKAGRRMSAYRRGPEPGEVNDRTETGAGS